MASTNKTENYGLNQWVKSDPVLMDDMNADNRKIDAAMKGLADEIKAGLGEVKAEISMVRLGKYTAADGNVNASFDLSGINVSDYSEFKIWIGGMSGYNAGLLLRFNNDSGANYQDGQSEEQSSLGICGATSSVIYDAAQISILCGVSRVHTIIHNCNWQHISFMTSQGEWYGSYSGCGESGLKSIQVIADGEAFASPVEVVLYGVLK